MLDEDQNEENKFKLSKSIELEDFDYQLEQLKDLKNIILYKVDKDIKLLNLARLEEQPKMIFRMEKKSNQFFGIDKNTGNLIFGDYEDRDAIGNSYISIVFFNNDIL